MDWYCELVYHLLDGDKFDDRNHPYEGVINELENRIVALYKALLQFQMKSACSYQKNQAMGFLRNTINLNDWEG